MGPRGCGRAREEEEGWELVTLILPPQAKEPSPWVFAKGQKDCAGQLTGAQGPDPGWQLL